ncbi:acyl-CoA dehydrogenase family protein [Marinobacter salexigens]|uniref:Acyl-CoA dehydrogenase family protein n=1 Tax=Marinobacter salexigens TaxID=1925763 RepID=A0ABS6A6E0_9GAMM|nr:acyl-CoA dehydrogenase family protein [Marinobacter salexigens]MBU2873614.1 acyl-CoA dehydrogenase family protein [Marinobacter salexigens]
MDFQLTEEQSMLVSTTAAFVEKELLPHEDAVEASGEVSPELATTITQKALEAGLYAFNMPESVGGLGIDHVSQALIERELAKVSWALQVFVARPSNILMACRGEQINDYLMPCVRGEKADCFALTEPGAGSDAAGITTRARKDGDSFVINGGKHFISHAGEADFAIVFAVTGTDNSSGRPRNQVTSFLVDKGTPGFTVRRGPICVSNRGYHQYEMFFDDCRVHESKVLGDVGKGWDVANAWLTAGRVMVAAHCVGQAQRAQALATQWAADRKQFGKAIGSNQGISFKLADMVTEIRAAELMTLHAAWKMDQGTMTDGDAGMAKLYASEMLGRVTDEAVQIYGGMGLMNETTVERLWRNARIERIWEGTSEIQRHIISKELLRAQA